LYINIYLVYYIRDKSSFLLVPGNFQIKTASGSTFDKGGVRKGKIIVLKG